MPAPPAYVPLAQPFSPWEPGALALLVYAAIVLGLMLINGRFYDRLTPQRVDALLEELRSGVEEPVRCK